MRWWHLIVRGHHVVDVEPIFTAVWFKGQHTYTRTTCSCGKEWVS